MKNSKVLSLLTAGAMVVSSFTGLAMNGGVALAAAGDNAHTTFSYGSDFYGSSTFRTDPAADAAEVWIKYDIANNNHIAVVADGTDGLVGDVDAVDVLDAAAAGMATKDADDTKDGITSAAGFLYATGATIDDLEISVDYIKYAEETGTAKSKLATAYLAASNGANYDSVAINVVGPNSWVTVADNVLEIEAGKTASISLESKLGAQLKKAIDGDDVLDFAASSAGLTIIPTPAAGWKAPDETVIYAYLNADGNGVGLYVGKQVAEASNAANVDLELTDANPAGGATHNLIGSVQINVKAAKASETDEYDNCTVTVSANSTDVTGKTFTLTQVATGTTPATVDITGTLTATFKGKSVTPEIQSVTLEAESMAGGFAKTSIEAIRYNMFSADEERFGDVAGTEGLDLTMTALKGQKGSRFTLAVGTSVTDVYTGKIKATVVAKDDDGNTFTGETYFYLAVAPAFNFTGVNFTPAGGLELSVGEGMRTVTATPVLAYSNDDFDASSLFYKWSWTVGGNNYELEGTKEYSNSVKVGLVGSTDLTPATLRVEVYASKDDLLAGATQLTAGNYAVTATGGYLDVAVDTSVFGDTGIVTSKSSNQRFAKAVSVKRTSGANIVEDSTKCNVLVFRFDAYTEAVYEDKVEDLYNGTWAGHAGPKYADQTGVIDVKNGAIVFAPNVAAGSYAVIAQDLILGTIQGCDTPIVVKTSKGVAVTGLTVDYNDVVLDNLNDVARVYACVQNTTYRANGYTKDETVSAEIDAMTVVSSNPSVVEAVLTGGKQKYGTTDNDMDNTQEIALKAKAVGTSVVTVTTVDGGFSKQITVTVNGKTNPDTPTPAERKAGDVFSVDGYTVKVLADLSVEIQDAPVASKSITIPEKVDGLTVSAIGEKAFKGSSAKKLYVEGAVEELGKASFKKSKLKKVFFYQPAALKTVEKKAFDKTNAKLVVTAVGGSFSDDVAKQLTKAGASKVKNNGTAK